MTVTFLSFNFEGSKALILVIVFVLGVLSGMFMTVPSFWRKSSALREQRRKVKQLEEAAAMKALPEDRGVKEEGVS